MRVLLVDDHALVREGLKLVLERLPEIGPVDEAGSLAEASARIAAAAYDLVLLDYYLPEPLESRILTELVAASPDTPFVIISGDRDSALVRELLATGARGFIPKQTSADVMLAALLVVVRGGTYVPTEALDGPSAPRPGPPATLTVRQREVLRLLVRGLTNKEIASEIGTSVSTVRVHVSAILRALEVENRTQACQVALAGGWLESS